MCTAFQSLLSHVRRDLGPGTPPYWEIRSPHNLGRRNYFWGILFPGFGLNVYSFVLLEHECQWSHMSGFQTPPGSGSSYCGRVLPCGSNSEESAWDAGDQGSIPELGRSSGEGNGNPLGYSCLENSMDREAWQATVHEVAVGHDWAANTHRLWCKRAHWHAGQWPCTGCWGAPSHGKPIHAIRADISLLFSLRVKALHSCWTALYFSWRLQYQDTTGQHTWTSVSGGWHCHDLC